VVFTPIGQIWKKYFAGFFIKNEGRLVDQPKSARSGHGVRFLQLRIFLIAGNGRLYAANISYLIDFFAQRQGD